MVKRSHPLIYCPTCKANRSMKIVVGGYMCGQCQKTYIKENGKTVEKPKIKKGKGKKNG